jgi:hypothetical protein
VPSLAPAWSVLRFIYSSFEQAQASKQQLQVLAQTIAQLLWTLNREYCSGQLLHAKTSMAIDDLGRFVILMMSYILSSDQQISYRLLNEISEFIQEEVSCPFLKLLFTKGQRIARIEEYHQWITTAVTSFQVSHDTFC